MSRNFQSIRAKNAFVRKLEARGISPTVTLDYKLRRDMKGPTRTVYTVSWRGDTRKNPTKAQKREKTRKASVLRRVAKSLAGFLAAENKQKNPASKVKFIGAKYRHNRDGSITIHPVKATRGRK